MRHPRPPRELDQLPYAHRMAPFTGQLEREGSYESLHFDGCAFEETDGGGSDFTESAFSQVTFAGGRYRRARFDDVWLHTTRWVGADVAETAWMDVECVAGVLAGTELFSAQLRRVTFHHCKFDSVNARQAVLRDVSFVDCLLREVDCGGASPTDVSFPGSSLDRVRFDKARVTRTDLREVSRLDIASGLDGLSGATINSLQLLELAPLLARTLGLTVRDGPRLG